MLHLNRQSIQKDEKEWKIKDSNSTLLMLKK